MVIVSPYARPGFVDHSVATDASMLAFVEANFGLAPLPTGSDGGAYAYLNSLNFSQRPLPPIPLPVRSVPASSERYMANHAPADDDPT